MNYELALLKTMNIYLVFYISLLEKAPERVPSTLLTEIQLVNPNAEYEVEEILDYKKVRGKTRYLIK